MQKRTLLLLAVVVLVGLTGCAGIGDDDSDNGAIDETEYVPSEALAVFSADPGITTDEATKKLSEAYFLGTTKFEDIEDAENQFGEETGLDTQQAEAVTVFLLEGESPDTGSSGVIIYSDWTVDEVRDAAENNTEVEYAEEEWDGVPVWVPTEDADRSTHQPFAVPAEGVFIAGDEPAVRAAVDVAAGNDGGVSGTLADAYNGASGGLLTAAIEPKPEDIPTGPEMGGEEVDAAPLKDITAIGVGYDTSDNAAMATVSLHAASESDASEIADVVEGIIGFYIEAAPQEDLVNELERIEVQQDGSLVEVSYEQDVDTIVDLIETMRGGA